METTATVDTVADRRTYDVIVIGGGASGLMAAGRAAERGRRVLLLEKNKRLGEKLRITGGGRCNITNAEEHQRLLLERYGAAGKFLYSSFSQFGMKDTFSFFESRGLPLVVQAGKRAFPMTEKAIDVLRVLEKYLITGRVTIHPLSAVTRLTASQAMITGVETTVGTITSTSYILATGGQSHPATGSTGDGLRWLEQLGHTVHAPTPTIVPIAIHDRWIKSLAGLAIDDVKISFFVNDTKQFTLQGRILCTHFGLSGPLILNAAGRIGDLLHAGEVRATIDAFPDRDVGGLDQYVTQVFDAHKNKLFTNVFKSIAPPGTARAILSLGPKIDPEKKVHSVTKEERKILVRLLKALPVSVAGLMGYDRAVVADGGVDIAEIDGKTMRSRRYKNLYITGDVLHIKRPSGGYSLQLCWTTGFVAGSSV